ncbi:polyphosphate polymerase domain-containing protein [Leucobacter tenebrionis]|uniref:polyphosphate polymerase domain-containing protein n=1 Tax=Leucobacter tenebrionis TaxID=2873270 RepID=UPI002106F14E|nr:polyphosphate polymerase domain-containing protein [Leucobacter tenebrionis]
MDIRMKGTGVEAGTGHAQVIGFEGLASISLEGLIAQAALLQRVDRKYLVPAADAAVILDGIDRRSRVLEIGGRRGFAYDSVYFDTPDHLSYRLTAQRRRRRFKLRTRSYLDTGTAYLELKTKSGRGSTVKDRVPYDPHNREKLTDEGREYVSALLEQHGHNPRLVERLRPSLVSRYRRATLLLPCGSRATIDTELRWTTADGEQRTALPGHVIIETKSLRRPSELDRTLWCAGYRPSGLSKFGTGTAALHPELPSNKWARTLRGAFSAQSTAAAYSHAPTPGGTS